MWRDLLTYVRSDVTLSCQSLAVSLEAGTRSTQPWEPLARVHAHAVGAFPTPAPGQGPGGGLTEPHQHHVASGGLLGHLSGTQQWLLWGPRNRRVRSFPQERPPPFRDGLRLLPNLILVLRQTQARAASQAGGVLRGSRVQILCRPRLSPSEAQTPPRKPWGPQQGCCAYEMPRRLHTGGAHPL